MTSESFGDLNAKGSSAARSTVEKDLVAGLDVRGDAICWGVSFFLRSNYDASLRLSKGGIYGLR
jgi:hypothetical protein